MTFHEDFFERVINITWEEEPEVYWAAGSGSPIIVNGMILGDVYRCAIFTSEDGHTWSKQVVGIGSGAGEWGFGGFFGGGWMRDSLRPGNDDEPGGYPIWVLVGSDGRMRSGWATAYSYDGKSFFYNNHNEADEHGPEAPHSSGEDFGKQRSYQPPSEDNPNGQLGQVRFKKMHNFQFSSRLMTSSDGVEWTESGPSSGAQPPIVVRATVGLVGFAADAVMRAEVTPMETPTISAVEKKARKKTFVEGTTLQARGKVRKGDFAGKVLSVKLSPNTYSFSAPAHGDGKIDIFVVNPETGQEEKVSGMVYNKEEKREESAASCGLERTVTIAYGHYAFVVGGSQGIVTGEGGSRVYQTAVAYSEDGFNWQTIILGPNEPINVIAVGPRPEQRREGPKEPQS